MARSPRQVRKNVQEAVTEQVRDLPIHAVRLAMFGVGRALLLSDRVTKDVKEIRESGVRPVLNRLKDDAGHFAGKVVSQVSGRANGQDEPETPVARPPRKVNTSLAAESVVAEPTVEPAAEPAAVEPAEPSVEPAANGEIAVGKPAPVEPVVTKATPDVTLPVPDYDAATLASVRARLRALSVMQVQELREYEAAHAARPDFIRMYDNRIAKLAES